MVAPKEKITARKWMSTFCGKDVIEKEKFECLTTFAPHNLPVKTECAEDLEFFWHK